MAVKSQKASSEITADTKEQTKPLPPRKDGILTKVILRRLPPLMTETELIEQISPLPPNDYFLFVPADLSLAPFAFTRAYINFTNVEDVILFRDRFDGYVFVDTRGNEYPAMVEMAPNSKVPKKKPKRDVKCGSLEDDPEYKKFLELLKNPEPVQLLTLDQRLEEIEKKEKQRKESKGALKAPTPLTEFIKQKREEKYRRQQEKKQQREEEKRKRLEREKQEEKRRQRREEERKEREAKKESDRSNIPPRFAAAKEAKEEAKERDYEKRRDETAATKPKFPKKSTGYGGRDQKQYYDDDKYYEEKQYYSSTSKYYNEKPAKKRQPTTESQQQSSRFMDKDNLAKMEKTRKSSLESEENMGGATSGNREERSGWTRGEERKAKVDRPPKKSGEDDAERQSKQRYKDRPSVPLYQPGRKKTEE